MTMNIDKLFLKLYIISGIFNAGCVILALLFIINYKYIFLTISIGFTVLSFFRAYQMYSIIKLDKSTKKM